VIAGSRLTPIRLVGLVCFAFFIYWIPVGLWGWLAHPLACR
jgi:hypothetical protein